MQLSIFIAVVLIVMDVAITFGETDLKRREADEMFPSRRGGCHSDCYRPSCMSCGQLNTCYPYIRRSVTDEQTKRDECQNCWKCGCPGCGLGGGFF